MIQKVRAATLSILLLLFFGISNTFGQSSPYTLPAGTRIRVKMDNEINSKVASARDTFTVTVASPLFVDQVEVIPAKAVVQGSIVSSTPASYWNRDGQMEIRFNLIRLPNGTKRDLDARYGGLLNEARSGTFQVASIVGGTAAGAVIGGAAKKGKGAAIGAGIGGAIGTLTAFFRKGREARIRADQEFEIVLNKEVTLPPTDF